MTYPRQPLAPAERLDELLKHQPLPAAEPTSAEWSTRLEQTMQRVRAMPRPGTHVDALDSDIEDVLATPLPVEPGEPEPSDPYAFEADKGATYDLLRAPLKSGEHAPLRLAAPPVGAVGAAESRPATSRGRLLLLATSVGALAAAAALVIALRTPTRDAPTSPLAKEIAEQPAAPAMLAAAEPAASVAVAATPQTEALPTEAKAAPATHSGTNLQRNHAAAAPAVAAAKAAPAPDEPELVPAAGPSSLVDHPSTGAISAALSRRLPEAQRCLPPSVPSTGARLTFRSNGTVQKVELQHPSLDGSARSCLIQALSGVRVEPFARSQFDVNATISQPAARNTLGN